MHEPTVSWRSKVLNHRSKCFFFFFFFFFHVYFWMVLAGVPIGKLQICMFGLSSFSIRQFDRLGFLSIVCELCTKAGTVRDQSECADASKVVTRCRSDVYASYFMPIVYLKHLHHIQKHDLYIWKSKDVKHIGQQCLEAIQGTSTTHTSGPKDRCREPSDTGSPGTDTGASREASPRTILASRGTLCSEKARAQSCARRMSYDALFVL